MKNVFLIPSFLILMLSSRLAWCADKAASIQPHPLPVKVAFVLGDQAVPTDFAGPWDVFSSIHLPDEGQGMDARMPFQLYTVGAGTAAIRTTGNRHSGMAITPDYSFDSAPEPDLIVVPAMDSAPGLVAWLQKMAGRDKTIVSICTGAFWVAKAGLLDGRTATTHRGTLEGLAKRYPKVKVVGGVRFVQDGRIYTSAGISAGIDLALHIVDQYYGRAVAQQTADSLEYESDGWKRSTPAPQSVNKQVNKQVNK